MITKCGSIRPMIPTPSPANSVCNDLTIVVATYNRPHALQSAIHAALGQSLKFRHMLVIGDCCDNKTSDVIDAVNDPRISYINLPQRCGEQSGPNSVGMALTETRFLAFLNHDDVWTPKHLEKSITALDESGADFYCARAAFVTRSPEDPKRYLVTEASPRIRDLSQSFYRPFYLFEPASAWVLKTEAACRVGPWRSAMELHRPPLADWLLRAWRCDLKLVCGREITVLKPRACNEKDHGYDYGEDRFSHLLEIAKMPASRRHQRIAKEIEHAKRLGISRGFVHPNADLLDGGVSSDCLTHEYAAEFKATGRDAYSELLSERKLQTGAVLAWALARRTGETLTARLDLDFLVKEARMQLGMRNHRNAR